MDVSRLKRPHIAPSRNGELVFYPAGGWILSEKAREFIARWNDRVRKQRNQDCK